eukprot:comp23743_c0_seq1/m.40980 comp23743_c0_seq1/g.40980  ORF comp23743_c0_seq1/g.40980 comp23743_c0_seq1/m.40980 type:complete len:287 (-) comp23743_c0_seq1:533-1393(-)
MQRCTSIASLRQLRRSLQGTVGFVPTMGCLHEGHLSLVRQAKAECDHVVASIFVNPAQFAAHEDLDTYPRPLESDLALLEKEGVHATFLPTVAEMYGRHKKFLEEGTVIEVKGLSHQLEGSVRPHFFRGVATVVCKLLNIVQPDVLYLGQKDGQQCVVVRNMIEDLKINTELRVGPTVREKDGLAMSSRNTYLSERERALAPILYQGLKAAVDQFVGGCRDAQALIHTVKSTIEAAHSELLTVQYVCCNDMSTLEVVGTLVDGQQAMLSAAMLCGKTRLIDNVILR